MTVHDEDLKEDKYVPWQEDYASKQLLDLRPLKRKVMRLVTLEASRPAFFLNRHTPIIDKCD